MGLKFKRFKAKLNWKPKETTPEVICLNYRITSEFDELPIFAVTTYTNGIGQNQELNTNKENDTPLNNATDGTKYKQNKIKTEPLTENKIELTVSKNNENVSWQPKSILKKTPDLEEHKESPLIFMTQNDDEEVNHKQPKPPLTQEQEHVELRSNLDNSDGKIVNWRNTIEVIDLKEKDTEPNLEIELSKENLNSIKDEEDKVNINTHFRNRTAYSTQAASIFFTSEDSNT